MNVSPIEWIRNDDGRPGRTWNPVKGCTRISPGCGGMIFGPNGEAGGCYAERLAGIRFSKNPLLKDWHGLASRDASGEPHWSGEVRFLPHRLDEPLRERKGTRVFVCDMSDLFHAKALDEQIAAIFDVMAAASQHWFYVLTKRDRRAEKWFREYGPFGGAGLAMVMSKALDYDYPRAWFEAAKRAPWPLPNLAMGVTVDDRAHGLPRIDTLRRMPAARKFLSVEPLLEDLGDVDLTGIDLVIVGGESGPGARPFDLRWARRLRAQCDEQGVGFFMKQGGDAARDGGDLVQLRKKGNKLEELPADLRRRDRLVFTTGPTRWERVEAVAA